MAFTYTSNKDNTGRALAYGTYTNTGGSTGGDIPTGLDTVLAFVMTPKGASVSANQSVYNETFPLSNVSGTVTIVTNADEVGSWIAFGNG